MMKRLVLFCWMTLGSVVAWAGGDGRLPENLVGNWSAVDGSRQWTYGFYPEVAVWRNAFWDYAGISGKGAVVAIRLRERGGDRTATLYARWNPKDSTARIGLSPKNLAPYSHERIADPSYRIPADEDPDYPAGDSILRDGIAVVRGYLDGYEPETMPRTITCYGFNTVTGQNMPAVADMAADGTFEMSVSLGHPITAYITLTKNLYDNIYLEPGDTLTLYYSLPDQQQQQNGSPLSRYMGRSGRVNSEMNDLRQFYHSFGREEQIFLMRTTPDSIRAWADERTACDSAATAAYIAANGISRKGAFLARWTLDVMKGELLGLYAMYREEKNPVDPSFFDFYRQLPLDDPRLLGINNHRFLINRLEFCSVYRGRPRMMGYRDLLRAGFEIAPDDMLRFDSLERRLYDVPGDSVATDRAIRAVHQKLDQYTACFQILSMMQRIDHVYAAGGAFWGRPMPFLNDLIAARQLHNSFKGPYKSFIPNRQWAQILAHFSTPYVVETLLEANDALRPRPVAAVAQGPYVPSDRAERLLDSLLLQHRGRVVYVDFWATSCGPCRQGMMESWKIKEKLAGQPVDFVYITSTNQSPEKVAADFIEKNKITGRQIRLRPDEWNILAAKYRISGIPHYMIVGPDGRVVDPHFRGYASEVIVSTLLKAAGVEAGE